MSFVGIKNRQIQHITYYNNTVQPHFYINIFCNFYTVSPLKAKLPQGQTPTSILQQKFLPLLNTELFNLNKLKNFSYKIPMGVFSSSIKFGRYCSLPLFMLFCLLSLKSIKAGFYWQLLLKVSIDMIWFYSYSSSKKVTDMLKILIFIWSESNYFKTLETTEN